MVVIVDWNDSKTMLVDGEDFPRVLYPLRRLTLTKFKLPLLRGARHSTVLKAAKAYDLKTKFSASAPARKLEVQAKRASLTDIERFSVMINRKRRSFAVRKLAKKAGAADKKAPAKKAVANKKK